MDKNEIKKVHMFSELDNRELEKISEFSHLKSFDKGEMIFFDTEPYLGFYAILRGSIKIFKISKDGKEHILHFGHKYDTFAEVPLFLMHERISSGNITYPANVMAIENDTKVLLIYSEGFLSILDRDKSLCFKMLASLSKRLKYMTNHIEEIAFNDIYKRLACYILAEYKVKQADKEGSGLPQIVLDVTKNDLASYLGTIYETLSRTFRKFQDEKILEVNGSQIIITDFNKLKRASI